jgi:hypothetical protein
MIKLSYIDIKIKINHFSGQNLTFTKLYIKIRQNLRGTMATMYRHVPPCTNTNTIHPCTTMGASEPELLTLNDKWKRMEEAVRKVVTNIIG